MSTVFETNEASLPAELAKFKEDVRKQLKRHILIAALRMYIDETKNMIDKRNSRLAKSNVDQTLTDLNELLAAAEELMAEASKAPGT